MISRLFSLVFVLMVAGCLSESDSHCEAERNVGDGGTFLAPEIVPSPVEMTIDGSEMTDLEKVAIAVRCCETNAAAWVESHFKNWFGSVGAVSHEAYDGHPAANEAAFRLAVKPTSVVLSARTALGIKYAAYALRQAAMPKRGTLKTMGWIVPSLRISDKPKFGFRGMHVCWTPERDEKHIERLIRMAAYYRFNYVVIEPWGTYRSEKFPWYGWRDAPMDAAAIGRLRKVAEDVGTTLVPQLNVYGHATGSRSRSGKHCVLDVHPEYAPLFEPRGGWNWCLSNSETLKVQEELIDEMLTLFGNPPYFHIGCDEAERPSCPSCAVGSYNRLFFSHVLKLHAFLAGRKVKVLMWHDKLLDAEDSVWCDWCAHGDAESERLALELLPRDVGICYWCYGNRGPVDGDYPLAGHFVGAGFPTIMVPWHGPVGIRAMADYSQKSGVSGFLGSTWAVTDAFPLADSYSCTACAAWGTPFTPGVGSGERTLFAAHWRQIARDAGADGYAEAGFIDNQMFWRTPADN